MFSDAWRNYKNILCIRLDNMGDVLMSQPAMRALKHIGVGQANNPADIKHRGNHRSLYTGGGRNHPVRCSVGKDG